MKKRIAIILCCSFLLLFIGINQNLSSQVIEQDSLALVALYDSTNGTNWTNNTSWLSGPVSTWFGITVSGERVTRLDLGDNNLVGVIPPEIGNLTNLTYLRLSSNQLSGSIPPEIGNLINLTGLYLRNNQLLDSIPNEIGKLTNLRTLNLRTNQLSGSIPTEIFDLTNLTGLNLHTNQLSDSIPNEIGNLSNLTLLYLGNNQLSGSIPSEIGNLTNLERFTLYSNQLSDSIPSEIGNFAKLKYFQIYDNQFTHLPDLTSDTALIDLRIQNNKFTFEDIEPNTFVPNYIYSPQDSVGEKQDTTVTQGSSLTLSVSVGGTANQYQWTKDEVDIPGAESNQFTIASVDSSDTGSYICRITNTIATELILYSRPFNVTVSGGVGVTDHSISAPKGFALYQNYPNPFNPSTAIKYDLTIASQVVLKIYSLFGQEIKTLVNEFQSAGEKMILWDGLNEQGHKVSSGVYFYKIDTESFSKSNKMIMIK